MTNSRSASPGPELIAQAAQWAAMIDAGDMSDADRQACARWRDADPLNRQTLERMLDFDARVQGVGEVEQAALKTLLEAPSRRRVTGAVLLAIALLATGRWLALRADLVRDHFPDYHTGRGEIRALALNDSSTLTLDTNGAVRVNLGKGERRVRLIQGRVLAKVAKDPTRPFVVETTHGSATALGTAFAVRRGAESTEVTVVSSNVRVCPGRITDVKACLMLGPGQRAMTDGRGVRRLADVSPDSVAQWACGWLEADDQDVVEVLQELRRYRRAAIAFDVQDLSGLKVTGSFPLADTDRALEGVTRAASLDLRTAPDGAVVVRRRR